jgi:uncharacterized protein YjeT (DUF2065 family)
MYRKSTLYLVAVLLVIEGIVLVAVPSRMPRPARAITAAVDLVAAAAVALLAWQKR